MLTARLVLIPGSTTNCESPIAPNCRLDCFEITRVNSLSTLNCESSEDVVVITALTV